MEYIHLKSDYSHYYNHQLQRYMSCGHADCIYCSSHNHRKFSKAISAMAPYVNIDLAVVNHLKPEATKFVKTELTKLINSKRFRSLKLDYEFKELVIAEAHARGDIHLNIYCSTKKGLSDLKTHPAINSLLTELYIRLSDFDLTTTPLNAESIRIVNAYNDAINPLKHLYAHKVFSTKGNAKNKSIQLTINNGKRYLYYRRGFFKTKGTATQKDAYKKARAIELEAQELMIQIFGSIEAYENLENWLPGEFYKFYKNNPDQLLSHLSKASDALNRLPEKSNLKKTIRKQIKNNDLSLDEIDRNLTKIIKLRKQLAIYYKEINKAIGATNLNNLKDFEKIAPAKFSIKDHKTTLRLFKAFYKKRDHLQNTKIEIEQFFNAIKTYETKSGFENIHKHYILELTKLINNNAPGKIGGYLKHLYENAQATNRGHCIYIDLFTPFTLIALATNRTPTLIKSLTYDLIYRLYPQLE